MKKLAIIGSAGMLGFDLVKNLSSYFSITPIFRDNYEKNVGKKFDIVINANGNSKRFWANQNPKEDFIASTESVYKSIFDFPTSLFIYISSPDVYPRYDLVSKTAENEKIDTTKLVPYGFNKYLSEQIVIKYCRNFLILRPSMMLGSNLKKGPFYDIINGKALFVTRDSKLQLITTNEIGKIILKLIASSVTNQIINAGGIGTFSFRKIKKHFKNEIKFSKESEKQVYEMSVKKLNKFFPKLKSSEEYLNDFLQTY